MSKKKLTYEDFKKYFGNNLHDKDKHAFEKKMMQDAFEEEAFDGLSELSKQELENDITELKAGINKRTKQKCRIVPVWYKYAASVIILVGIGLTIFFLNSRFWQDMMLKNQVAKEMEITDSLVNSSEKSKTEHYDKLESEATTETSGKLKVETEKTNMKESSKKITQNDLLIKDNMEISEPNDEQSAEVVEFLVSEEELLEDGISPLTEKKVAEMETRETVEEVVANQEKSTVSISQIVSEADMNRLASRTKKTATPESHETDEGVVIRGKIVSSDNDLSIPGVSVMVKDNPSVVTTTDMEGEFELSIPNDEELKTLIASFVGMENQEITIENDTNILVYMEPDVLQMDEVVVIGYAQKSDKKGEDANTKAQPPGGLSLIKYKKQIQRKLDYSKLDQYPGKHRIEISFTVEVNGNLSNFSFKNVPGVEFSNEIKRVVKNLGKWKPAIENDFKISSKINMSLKVEIEE